MLHLQLCGKLHNRTSLFTKISCTEFQVIEKREEVIEWESIVSEVCLAAREVCIAGEAACGVKFGLSKDSTLRFT